MAGELLRRYQRRQRVVQNPAGLQAPGAQLKELHEEGTNVQITVRTVVRIPKALEPAQVQTIQAALRRYVAPDLDLVILSVVGAEASATGYLPVNGEPR